MLEIPKIYFSLRKDVRNRTTNECLIYIQFCVKRRTIRFDTGLTCPLKQWNKKTKKVSRSHPNHVAINEGLRQIKSEYDARLLANPPKDEWSVDVIRQIFSSKDEIAIDARKEEVDFIYLVNMIMENEYKAGRVGISVLDNAKCNMNIFRKFLKFHLKRETISPGELTVSLIDDYITYRKEVRENDNFTINKALTPIFKAVQYAHASEMITAKTALLITSKYLSAPKKDLTSTDKEIVRYLSKEQLKALLDLYPTLYYSRTRDFLDMFLFSFHACGLRFSDVMTLTWANVDFDKGEIHKVLVKGKVPHTIPLTDAAKVILNRWKGRKGCEMFCFGLLPSDFPLNDDAAVKKARINKNTSVRTSLKEVGRKLGLDFNLTFHCARHTFAVLALSEGKLSLNAISKLMGHASILVTERVYAQYLPSKLKEELGTDFFGEFEI